MAGPHLPALDGFRAVAALSVIVFHAGYGNLFDGVTGFFVLSGFLITTLLLREREAKGANSLVAFYMRRTLRIFPAYYACVAVSLAIDFVAGNRWPDGLAASALLYVVNYFNAFNGHPNTSIAHLWSLGVEEQFYLLWPAAFILLAPLGRRGIQYVLLAVVVGGVAWKYFLHFGLGLGQAYLYNAFDARFDNLAIGCLLAMVVTTRGFQIWAERLSMQAWMPLVTLLVMYAVSNGLTSLDRHLFGFTVYSMLVALLIVQLMLLHRSLLWSWLELAPVRFLGTISYPIYLYHSWGIELGRWLSALSPFQQFVVGLLLSIAAATGSYYLVERPFLRLKRRFAARDPRPVFSERVSPAEAGL